jgi:hypothetical protein
VRSAGRRKNAAHSRPPNTANSPNISSPPACGLCACSHDARRMVGGVPLCLS